MIQLLAHLATATIVFFLGFLLSSFMFFHTEKIIEISYELILIAIALAMLVIIFMVLFSFYVWPYFIAKIRKNAQQLSNLWFSALDNNVAADLRIRYAHDAFSIVFEYLLRIQYRRFLFAGLFSMAAAFTGLIGAVLLKKQNDLITQKNQYFQRQIDQQTTTIEMQSSINNQNIKTDAIKVIYGQEFRETPRAKGESVRALIGIERANIVAGQNSISSEYINLHEADLREVLLETFDLKKTSFRGSNLRNASLGSADASQSVFFFVNLTNASLGAINCEECMFSFSNAPDSFAHRANFTNASFNQTILSKANFSSAKLKGAKFYKCDLASADFKGVEDWQQIESFEGSYIGDVSAPDGFREFALSRGATLNPDIRNTLLGLREQEFEKLHGRKPR